MKSGFISATNYNFVRLTESSGIAFNDSETSHCDAGVEHRHQVIRVFVCPTLQLLGLTFVQSSVVINGLLLDLLDFGFELLLSLLVLFLLLFRPRKDLIGLLF